MSDMLKLEDILNGYKVGELKELAKVSGVTGYSKLKKAELVEVIVAQLTQTDVTSLEIPDEIKEALTPADTEASKDDTVEKSEETSSMKAGTTAVRTPIIGVAPHIMNVRQENQPPFIPVNQPEVPYRKVYPNEPCPCGSNKKYKKCCGSY